MRVMALLMIACGVWAQDGAALFEKHCATCHRPGANTRAPLREALARMPSPAILATLETGTMKTQGAALTASERRALAEFLSTASMTIGPRTGFCAAPAMKLAGPIGWNGWGVDLSNTRFQPSPGLTAQQVPTLKLKWAFGCSQRQIRFRTAHHRGWPPVFWKRGRHRLLARCADWLHHLDVQSVLPGADGHLG